MLAIVEAFLPETGQWLGLAAMLLVLVLFAGLGRIRGDDDDIPGVSFLTRMEYFRGSFDDCRRLRRLAFLAGLLGPLDRWSRSADLE